MSGITDGPKPAGGAPSELSAPAGEGGAPASAERFSEVLEESARSVRAIDVAEQELAAAERGLPTAEWVERVGDSEMPPASVEAPAAREIYAWRAIDEVRTFDLERDMADLSGLARHDDASLLPHVGFRAHDSGQVFLQVYPDGVLFTDKATGRSYEILQLPDGSAAIADFPGGERWRIDAPVVFAFQDGTRVYAANRPWAEVVIAKQDGDGRYLGRHIGFENADSPAFDGPADPILIADLEAKAQPAVLANR